MTPDQVAILAGAVTLGVALSLIAGATVAIHFLANIEVPPCRCGKRGGG